MLDAFIIDRLKKHEESEQREHELYPQTIPFETEDKTLPVKEQVKKNIVIQV